MKNSQKHGFFQSIASFLKSGRSKQREAGIENKNKNKWLYIGDSITDSGRKRDPEGLGFGYVRMVRDEVMKGREIQFVNKGVSGNRISDLEDRWQEDVMAIDPDVLSISIGINDVWRQLSHPEMTQVYPEDFHSIYERLLDATKSINAKVVLMEPTIIEEDLNSKGNQMLIPYVEIVRSLAKKYDAVLVPTHAVFLNAVGDGGATLTTDGVHMTEAGNRLMADTWLNACKGKLLR
ncbi:SGNH/GDSL hydrolase family protein [Pseudalkalibacillus hwajinpoensis]|uniref:SGNH/GDSL hydrolase family protein n=1 Tax=Guptibacillus hwajinpoensis TaxID=208199 RepID=UPI00325BF250